MATDTSKQCNITNNSGWDVIVALATNRDESDSSNAVVVADGSLELLKTSGGSTVIKNGSADTVTLDRNYRPGSGESGSITNYDLQVCDSAWLYPVANVPVSQQSGNGAAGFGAQTVTKENREPMDSAADFYQTIMAYPDSQLTDNYATALQTAKEMAIAKADDSAGSAAAAAGAIEDTMDAFFANTDKYKEVMLADVVAIGSYYNNFPAVWAQYEDSMTYYLYSSDETTATFAGTLMLKKSGPMDAAKPAGGYTCSFVPAVDEADTSKTDVDQSKAVPLAYTNGLFTDDPEATTPKIGLKGSFMLKRLFTTNTADNSLLSVIAGTINGLPCVGFDKPQPAQPTEEAQTPLALTADSAEQFWDTLIDPKTQYDLMVSILVLTGTLTLLTATGIAIYGIYRLVKNKAALKEALSKQIIERTWEEEKDAQQERIESDAVQFVQNPAGERLGDFFVEFNPKNVAGYYKVVRNNMLSNKLIEAFAAINESLAEISSQSFSFQDMITPIQNQLDAIQNSVDNLQNTRRTDLEKVLPQEMTNFSKVQNQVKAIYTKVNEKITDQESRATIDNNIISSSKLFDEVEKGKTEETKEERERDPELLDKLIPELETF